jgi:hypothetical protein
MIYKHDKFGFTKKTNWKSVSFRRNVFVVAVVVLSLIVPAFVIFQLFSQPMLVEHHGPNPDTQLTSVAPESGLGQDSTLAVSDTQNILGTSVSQPENQSQSQLLEKDDGYGIAAGGGLIFRSQDYLNQYFNSLKSLGVQWVRWDIEWSIVQKDGPTSYDWSGTDRVATTAKQYGINSLAIIDYAPKWASVGGCKTNSQCAPVDSQSFAKFVGETALRYKDSIEYWEIWNEPNIPFSWNPRPDAKKYAEMLKDSYEEIKKTNPSAIVLSGGLAASDNEKNGSISPLTFMSTLYSSDTNKYFDAVAIHPYSFPASPNNKAWWNSWQQILPIRQLMNDNGDYAKKIWLTEYGTPTGGPGKSFSSNQVNGFNYGSDFMKESAQSDMMTEALSFYHQNTDWMGPFFWYSLRDASDKRDDPENYFGLLRYDGSKKPAYDVFKNAIHPVE